MKDDQVSLYNWSGQDGEVTILFVNNVLGKDIPENKYVYNAGSDCKLAELFAASIR